MLQLFLKRSARQQWGIFLAGLFLLLATIVAAFTWYVFREGLNESVDRSRDLARTAATKLEVILDDNHQILTKMSETPAVKQFDTQACDPIFFALNRFRFSQFERISLLDINGRIICPPDLQAKDRQQITTDHPWFQAGLKAESYAVGHIFRGYPSMRWMIPLTHTVRNEKNEVTGLLVLSLDVNTLRERVFTPSDSVVGFRGGVSDASNVLLLHNDPQMIGETINPTSQRSEKLSDDSYRVLSINNVWQLCGAAPARGANWRAFLCIPEDFALIDARRQAGIAAGIGVLVFGLFALMMLLFSRVSVARDDTQTRRVGELNRLQDFLWDNIPMGIAFFDASGAILDTNEQFTTMLGRDRALVIGHKLNEYSTQPSNQIHIVLRKRGYNRWTTVFKRPDGTSIDIETTAKRFVNRDRDVFIGVFRDFTDIKRAEAKLLKSEEFLEQTGRVAGVGGWELDLATMTPRWTSQTHRLHEVEPDYKPNLETAINFYPPEARPTITKAVDDALKFGIAYDLELPFVTAKGRALWVRAQGKPILEDGKVTRLIGSFQDITARRQADQDLEEQRAKAEIANKAKSSFLAIMSHELRTPLTGILGMADLLLVEELAPQHHQLVERLSKSGRILLDLINDVLDFSKIEANKLSVDHVPFVPRDIFDSARDMLTPLATEKGLVLSFDVADELSSSLLGDPKRLRQVLVNLIGNAVKFTSQGRIVVTATMEANAAGEDIMCAQVSDTGAGISRDDQANLFMPYVQGDQRLAGHGGGTGLGLAICRLLVEAMGGEISVATQPGEGSTFTFKIKLGKNHAKVSAATDVARSTTSPARQSLRILVAEDNETSRYLINEVMTRKLHHVECFENGAKALDAAKTKPFDFILMDMQMPVMNGIDAVREIRKLKVENAKLPIIALTADLIDENRSRYIEAGVDAIVGKPIDWAALESEMNRLLDAYGRSNQNQATLNDNGAPVDREIDLFSETSAFIDHHTLNDLSDFLGQDKVATLLASFRENVATYRADLHTHVASGDLKQAKRTAHALRGLSVQFGAVTLGRAATEIEHAAESIEVVRDALPEIDRIIFATMQEIDALPPVKISANA